MRETLVATCIGGVLALTGGVVGAWMQNYFNSKWELRKEKLDAYITMAKALTEYKCNKLSEKTREKVIEAGFYIDFFAPKRIVKQLEIVAKKMPYITDDGIFPKLNSEDLDYQMEKLENLMKADLNKR